MSSLTAATLVLALVCALGHAAPIQVHVVVDPDAAAVHGAASFGTVSAARDHLRCLRAAGGLGAGARVVLHAGTHAPFALDAALDSGAPGARITYEGLHGAVVSGGIEVSASSMHTTAALQLGRAPRRGCAVRLRLRLRLRLRSRLRLCWTLNPCRWSCPTPLVVVPGFLQAKHFSPVKGKPGLYAADLTKLGLGPADFGSLPSVGDTIHLCDQLNQLKMMLYHTGTRACLR